MINEGNWGMGWNQPPQEESREGDAVEVNTGEELPSESTTEEIAVAGNTAAENVENERVQNSVDDRLMRGEQVRRAWDSIKRLRLGLSEREQLFLMRDNPHALHDWQYTATASGPNWRAEEVRTKRENELTVREAVHKDVWQLVESIQSPEEGEAIEAVIMAKQRLIAALNDYEVRLNDYRSLRRERLDNEQPVGGDFFGEPRQNLQHAEEEEWEEEPAE
jgi:hypothetical protein